jgi:hypothetical protein
MNTPTNRNTEAAKLAAEIAQQATIMAAVVDALDTLPQDSATYMDERIYDLQSQYVEALTIGALCLKFAFLRCLLLHTLPVAILGQQFPHARHGMTNGRQSLNVLTLRIIYPLVHVCRGVMRQGIERINNGSHNSGLLVQVEDSLVNAVAGLGMRTEVIAGVLSPRAGSDKDKRDAELNR